MEKTKLNLLDLKLKELIDRFPQSLDRSIFKEKDRIVAYFDDEFFLKRSTRYLLRLLSTQFLKKKKLLSTISLSPIMRSLELRIMPTKLEFPFASKWVIGILIQLSLNNRYEIFDQQHLVKAVQKINPNLRIVKGSIYIFEGPEDNIKTFYAEFEKNGNHFFTLSELNLLKMSLGNELLLRIERLVPAVFMTRNQEEVLRNILTLSQEIEVMTDLPQVMISFERQTTEEFVFTVLCVCPETNLNMDHLWKQTRPFFQWQLERKQLVKYLDQHQPVFAYIFRVLVTPHPSILRSDGSLNFFAARQRIGNLVNENIGEFRDFNGGILIKQEESLHSLKNALPDVSPELIENVFYAITPIEMQAILPLHTLKILFRLFIEISEQPLLDPSHYLLHSNRGDHLAILMVRIPNGSFYETAKDHLLAFDLPDIKLASIILPLNDSYLMGYILETENSQVQNRFLESLEKLLTYWSDEVKKQQVLRLSLEFPISSMDPRIGGNGLSPMFLKLLFEGLMRIGPLGNLEKGLAEHVEISPDRKTYLFTLRPSFWSDGSPVTSYDFEYTWKKILSPRFQTPFAYLFYLIKNAELAKKGIVPMNQMGIQALGEFTLKVELESPSPNFLEFLALSLFSPVCRQIDINEPNWPLEEGSRYICNGAFTLERHHKDVSYVLVKNPYYWNKEQIQLDRILVTMSHHTQTYAAFSQNKSHWIGAPGGSWKHYYRPGINDESIVYPDQGLYWCVCNTKHPLLKNNNIRRALALAINRCQLLETMQYPGKPAHSPLPSSQSQIARAFPFDGESEKTLFRNGLEESGFSHSEIPPLTIDFTHHTLFGKATAESLSLQWKQKLGITATIQNCDYDTIFSKLTSGNFEIALIRWQSWVNDPFYSLNFFANPDEPMNFSKWSSPHIQALLQKAHLETDEEIRKLILMQIEEILINEVPIIPLFETCLQFMKKKSLLLTPNHPLIDFKWAKLTT